MDQLEEKVSLYLERVAVFMKQAQGWCAAQGLSVEGISTELFEDDLPKYQATGLRVRAPDGQPLADLLPTGSAIIGALGRIDLQGTLTRHALLFQAGRGQMISASTLGADGRATADTLRPLIPGIDGDGWYWHEGFIRRAKRVDESLFLDLLTDVSDYEFQ